MAGKLSEYSRKRRLHETPEPGARRRCSGTGGGKASAKPVNQAPVFVVQEHDARRLHYDFRLEIDGVLKSWAVPKGPSLDPALKRLAVQVEDHPLEYGGFEGEIPAGHYGAGRVIVWDRGTWLPQDSERAARAAYLAGKLKFQLRGAKLTGGWMLVRSRLRGSGDKPQWLLMKERDAAARDEAEYRITEALPGSVLSGVPIRAPEPELSGEREPQARESKARATGSAARASAAAPVRPAKKAAPQTPRAVSRRARLPALLEPQLATLVAEPPAAPGWAYEIKFDGYRLLARLDAARRRSSRGTVRLFTRNGHDWSARFPAQIAALQRLQVGAAWLDGEAVVLDEHGVPSFQALQNAFETGRSESIVLYLFDAPFLHGRDLREVALAQRRAALREALAGADARLLRFSEDFDVGAGDLLQSACKMSLEGIIGKRLDSLYRSGRSADWIKLKCRQRQEFIVVGYTEPRGARHEFGALLLGIYGPDGALQYAGRVGTGFDQLALRDVKHRLVRHASAAPPLQVPSGVRRGAALHWVKPVLVVECEFAQWTDDGSVRQASFIGFRDDKPARQIVRELAQPGGDTMTAQPKDAPLELDGVDISHDERVIDRASGTTKGDLARYYAAVAPWMLPHLHRRPVSLVRAPDGIDGELFFQKHSAKLQIPHMAHHAGLDPGHAALMSIDRPQALLGAVQMNAVEFHTWNALVDRIEQPDRMVFDLDPGEKLGWEKMIQAAQLLRGLLDDLGLASFCKTSGGKGLHVVVPLLRHGSWDGVRAVAQAVSLHMANTLPGHFAEKSGPRNRIGKIYVDYLRDTRGASTVAAFSARARPGMGVSMPIAWDELDTLQSGAQWNVGTAMQRLAGLQADPWADYAKTRQRLTAAMRKKLGLA